MASTSLPIPAELLSHPSVVDHPEVLRLHQEHGGIPLDGTRNLDPVLDFVNAVASPQITPGGAMRRTDPSPRRAARVLRSQLLGTRDPSVSPDRSPVRYRSRSRNPGGSTGGTIKEEPEDDPNATATYRPKGARDYMTADPGSEVANRLSSHVQQTHDFQERVLRRVAAVERAAADEHGEIKRRLDVWDARVGHYLGVPLVPVPNAAGDPVPDLPPLTSVDAIWQLSAPDVRAWIKYYTGHEPDNGSIPDLRRALRVCTGVEATM